jgi:hypothetical protein
LEKKDFALTAKIVWKFRFPSGFHRNRHDRTHDHEANKYKAVGTAAGEMAAQKRDEQHQNQMSARQTGCMLFL